MTDGAVYLPLNIGRAGSFFLPQRPFIAVGTLRDQILYPDRAASQDCGDEELVGILKQLQLAYLLSMEGGLDAVQRWDDILSPGEQQRLQFARLLYHKPMFAFMDEVCTVLPCVCVRAHHCVAQPVALWLWRGVCRCLDDNRGNHTTEHQRASGSARGTVHAASTTGGAPLGFGCALRWRTERGVCVWLCGCVAVCVCGCGCVVVAACGYGCVCHQQAGVTCISVAHRPTLVRFHTRVLTLDGNGGYGNRCAGPVCLCSLTRRYHERRDPHQDEH